MEFTNDVNKCLGIDYLSPFDFVLEEIKCKEINKAFETARKVLNIKSSNNFISIRGKHYEDVVSVARFVNEINPNHLEALIALNQLFTIAEAWNKADGFVPDYTNLGQEKWFPWFSYDKKAARFVCATTGNAPSYAAAYLGCRLCFKTMKRAAQFGKQFAELYNKVFLP